MVVCENKSLFQFFKTRNHAIFEKTDITPFYPKQYQKHPSQSRVQLNLNSLTTYIKQTVATMKMMQVSDSTKKER